MNTTLREFLEENSPGYLEKVDDHWLEQTVPSQYERTGLAIAFFILCVPSQICQILVIAAFCR